MKPLLKQAEEDAKRAKDILANAKKGTANEEEEQV
jgi:hypothetical protein